MDSLVAATCISSETFGTPSRQEEWHASAAREISDPWILSLSPDGSSFRDEDPNDRKTTEDSVLLRQVRTGRDP